MNLNDPELINAKPVCADLALIDNLIFKHCRLQIACVEKELESKSYFAHSLKLGNQNVKFRMAKITPTKLGQFVTIWKRNEDGITTPFDISDDIDFYLIATRKDMKFGVFVFPKMILYRYGIISGESKMGKRGTRVYPDWDRPTSVQAQKAQLWQSEYFLELTGNIDVEKARKILNP